MTPPVRPNWDDPDAWTLREAMQLARQQAQTMDREVTIAVYVEVHQLVFSVMLSGAYDELEKSPAQKHRLARIVRVQPDGSATFTPTLTFQEHPE